MNETLIVTLFVIFAIIYFSILGGVIYLSYRYIKYINDLDKTGCKCSEDTKRDMVKNFSYLILIGWLLFIVILLVSPPKQLINIYTSKIYAIIQFLIIGEGPVPKLLLSSGKHAIPSPFAEPSKFVNPDTSPLIIVNPSKTELLVSPL